DTAVKNAVAKNVNDSIMIEKKMNRHKIDPLMATIFAYVIASEHEWTQKRLCQCSYRRCDDEENLICTCGNTTIRCGLNRAVLRLVYTLEAVSLYYWWTAAHRPLRRFKSSV